MRKGKYVRYPPVKGVRCDTLGVNLFAYKQRSVFKKRRRKQAYVEYCQSIPIYLKIDAVIERKMKVTEVKNTFH